MADREGIPTKKSVELSQEDKNQLTLVLTEYLPGMWQYLINFRGKVIGNLILDVADFADSERKIVPIYNVFLNDSLGIGIGKEVYRRANAELKKQGLTLASGRVVVSGPAERVWRSLIKSGEAEYIGPPERYKFKS